MIKSFSQFVNENEQPEFLTKLKRLRELGLVSQEQYLQDLVRYANEIGLDPSALLEPGDLLFDVRLGEHVGQDELEGAREWIESWRGRKRERIVMVTGRLDWGGFDLDLVLSSGARMHFYWPAYGKWGLGRSTVRVGGREWHLSEKAWEEITETFYDDGWERYMHELLSATVELSY